MNRYFRTEGRKNSWMSVLWSFPVVKEEEKQLQKAYIAQSLVAFNVETCVGNLTAITVMKTNYRDAVSSWAQNQQENN